MFVLLCVSVSGGICIHTHTQVGNDQGTQYRHGVYFHTPEQKASALKVFEEVKQKVIVLLLMHARAHMLACTRTNARMHARHGIQGPQRSIQGLGGGE